MEAWPGGSARQTVDDQDAAVNTGHPHARAGRHVRTAQRPVAVAEHGLAGAVTDPLGQGHDLADVALADAMRRLRALHFALLDLVLAPEVQPEDRRGEDQEPAHTALVRGDAAMVRARGPALNCPAFRPRVNCEPMLTRRT